MAVNIQVVFIYAPKVPGAFEKACRFAMSYHEQPPEYPHGVAIVLNDCELDPKAIALFGAMQKVQYFKHDDSGWDIGAYIEFAKGSSADLLFCIGGNTYFPNKGWLRKIAMAYAKYGFGIYGTMASNQIRPHLRTTGIAFPPQLLAQYPRRVITKDERYEFEHGRMSITRLAAIKNIPCVLVTWDGQYLWKDWRKPANGYHSGNQSNCLCRDDHTDRYETSDNRTKSLKRRDADNLPA